MAISPVGTVYGSVQTRIASGSCPTCGNSAARTAQAYGSYTGRDTYTCATCGRTLSSSSYCPTCNKTASSSTASSSYCPTCNRGNSSVSTTSAARSTSGASGTVYGKALSWVR